VAEAEDALMSKKPPQGPIFPCPFCGQQSMVKDSRPAVIGGASAVRRRRLCLSCNARWTTWETQLGGGRLEQHLGSTARAAAMAMATLQNLQAEITQLTVPQPQQEPLHADD